ncbi:MAG: hypothetical protein QUU85_14625, partial [Candidatus Eisenbacteria bacterium]|nr:hypothetical protein [Candidatus Eisenbacteria bacterium]
MILLEVRPVPHPGCAARPSTGPDAPGRFPPGPVREAEGADPVTDECSNPPPGGKAARRVRKAGGCLLYTS